MSKKKASEDVRSLQLTLGVYLFIFAAKLVVYFLSGVVALYAEAMHTLSDIFISGFLLVAAWYSRKAADKVHMFGYGRAQNVAALVAATLFISFTSFELYREAIPRLFRHEQSEYQNLPLVLVVLALSMIIAAAPLYKLFVQKTRGAAARAQLTELVNDELGLWRLSWARCLSFGAIPSPTRWQPSWWPPSSLTMPSVSSGKIPLSC